MRHDAHELGLQALTLPKLRVLSLELGPSALQLFGHPVERGRELADFPGPSLLEPHREIALREPARGLSHGADRPCSRASQVKPEENDEERGAEEPCDRERSRAIRLSAG